MAPEQMQPDADSPRPPTWRDGLEPKYLLASGVLAGPLFVTIAIAQMLFRTGFDPKQHPVSLLSVGAGGWVQITNFVVAGILILGCAVGARRVLRGAKAGTWGPGLLGLTGLAFIWGGVFTSDPSLGFPPGTPEGIPDQQSWHSALHQASPAVAFAALAMACLVFARRFLGMQRRGWMLYSILTPLVAFVLTSRATSGDDFDFRFLLAGIAVLLGWLSGLAAHLRDRNDALSQSGSFASPRRRAG